MFFHNTPFQNRHTINIVININEIKVNKTQQDLLLEKQA